MKDFFTQLLKNLYINQNFIWLIFLFMGVCYAYTNKICCLCRITFVLFIVVGVSVIISAIAYTIEYWAQRIYKRKCYSLKYKYRYDITVANPPACSNIEKLKQIDELLDVKKHS